MKQALTLLAAMAGLVLLLVFAGCFYSVREVDHVIITQFGKVIGEPISTPGLKFKTPFIQKVNRIEKQLLNWDGRPIEIPTRDKAYISVDTFARWRITDPRSISCGCAIAAVPSLASKTSSAAKPATPSPGTI